MDWSSPSIRKVHLKSLTAKVWLMLGLWTPLLSMQRFAQFSVGFPRHKEALRVTACSAKRHHSKVAHGSHHAPRAHGPPPPSGRNLDKLERFLSKAGVLSRAEARARVRRGEVKVNGRAVSDPWQLVHLERDTVEVQGHGRVVLPDWTSVPPKVILYNKPIGVVVTLRRDDPLLNGRPCIADVLPAPYCSLLAPHAPALRPVGRLDAASVGLLLMTDSSGLASCLTEPGRCKKEYMLRVHPPPSDGALARLRGGVEINDGNFARGPTRPCDIEVVEHSSCSAVLRFTIQEGRNRQLRRMCASEGLEVDWLLRKQFGSIKLGSLPLGEAREATEQETFDLLALASMTV